jgi:hypothetical protein
MHHIHAYRSEEGAPLVEFMVEEENPQELPPEGKG